MSSFAIIKLHSSIELSHLFSLLVIDFAAVLIGLIIFGGAGTIYSKSCGMLETLGYLIVYGRKENYYGKIRRWLVL